MTTWKDTFAQLAEEIETAKTVAVNAFMAAVPDSPIGAGPAGFAQQSRQQVTESTPLSSDDVAKLKIVVWRAISQAIQTHIGPVSSDGSILFGIVRDENGVPQLDMRGGQTWMHTKLQPVISGLPGPREAMLWQEDPITGLPVGLWLKNGDADGQWSLVWPDIDEVVLPATVAATLFPAEVADSLYKGAARGLLQHGADGAVLTATGAYSTWYVGAAAQRLYIRDTAGGNAPVNDGDLVGYWLPGLVSGSHDRVHLGLYEVVDCGEHQYHDPLDPPGVTRALTTVPVIRRVFSANTPAGLCHHSKWSIAPGPVEYSGYGFTMETADPIVVDVTLLDFSAAPGFVATPLYDALLTGPQCSSLGASSDTQAVTVTPVAGSPAQFFAPFGAYDAPPHFWTRGLNRTTLDAGIYGATMLVTVSGGDLGAMTLLGIKEMVRHSDGSFDVPFLDFTGPPLPLGTSTCKFQGNLVSAATCSPTDELAVSFPVQTSSTTPVTVTLTWQDPGRTTRLTVPFELTISGAATGRHNDLSGRGIDGDKDVASTDPTKSDTCHPWSALGPAGRMHAKLGVATLTGSGTTRKLVMPADCSVAKLAPTTSEVIYGIDRSGFSVVGMDTSDEIRILVLATPTFNVTFAHEVGAMGGDAMHVSDVGKNVTMNATTMMRFARDPTTGTDGIWRRL